MGTALNDDHLFPVWPYLDFLSTTGALPDFPRGIYARVHSLCPVLFANRSDGLTHILHLDDIVAHASL